MLRFLILLCAIAPVWGAEMVFEGTIERLGSGSLTLKLPDHTQIDALLPARPSTPIHVNEVIEIACRKTRGVWEDETDRFQFLEITKMRVVRGSSPVPADVISKVYGDSPELDRSRKVNMEYAKHLPNFVADEIMTRYVDRKGTGVWKYDDTIESEVSMSGRRAVRKNIRRNGKDWNLPFQALPGFVAYGGLGAEIAPVFDVACPTNLQAEGSRDGRLVYRFESPVDGCFGRFTIGYKRFNPPRTGQVFVNASDGHMVEFEEDATGFPEHFEFAERRENIRWDYVKIGDQSHLLPVHAEFLVVYRSGGRRRLVADYTNHRHFEAATHIEFQ